MRSLRTLACLIGGLLLTASAAEAAGEFEFRDGDRVVLLGGTFIERAQQYGVLESVLTTRWPDRNVMFRNLGWSADTVWAESRGIFDPPSAGYARMIEQVKGLQPTVIVVSYGFNEAFAGEPALARFLEQYRVLLHDLKGAAGEGVRFVMLSPHPHQDLGPPLPNPAPINRNLALYTAALKQFAGEQGIPFVDLFTDAIPVEVSGHRRSADSESETDNGLHLTESGYRAVAAILDERLFGRRPTFEVALSADGKRVEASGGRVEEVEKLADGLRFRATAERLPLAGAHDRRALRIEGLPAGDYELSIDGAPVLTLSAGEWANHSKGWLGDADREQAERLREAIIDKNELYFHRWRPQNVTYLFGFRKHEQGQNAVEIPQFDPLIEEKEAEIAVLRVPRTRTYELRRVASTEK